MIGALHGRSALIVCHCKGVTDRTIRQAIREGASCRIRVGLACKAGRACGGCAPAIDQILESERETALPPDSFVELAATG